MPEIEIEAEALKKVAEELVAFSKKRTPKVMSMALNDAAIATKTEAKRQILSSYELKSSYVNKKLSLKKAYASNLNAVVSAIDNRIGLVHFLVEPKKPPQIRGANSRRKAAIKPVKVKIKNDEKVVKIKPSPFVQKANGAINVFARTGKSRFPIKRLSTVGVAEMVASKEISKNVTDFAQKKIDERVQHHIGREMEKIKGGSK